MGGGRHRVQLCDADSQIDAASDDLLALDEALHQLLQTDPVSADLIKLRYFAGMTMPQAAQTLGIPLRTAERNWTYARTWLHREMSKDDTVAQP